MHDVNSLGQLPQNLPAPLDDHACDHLPGQRLPAIRLPSTAGKLVDLSRFQGWTVIYIYPRTGQPGKALPEGWNMIPGARGCTPQSCAFRDHYQELQALGAEVFGLSTQDTAYQHEAAARLHLPFSLLSDSEFRLSTALHLPTFEVAGMTLIKRLTLIIHDQHIKNVFYPVFPPDQNAEQVLDWLRTHAAGKD